MFNLLQPFAHIVAKFFLDGKEYEVATFKVGFTQEIDYKGQPQHETRGGQIVVKIAQAADENLYEWAKRSTLLKSGTIVFETEMSSPIIRLEFSDAYCVGLTRILDARYGTKTSIIISPEVIKINDIEHDNFWKK
jgi:hypothetical protein